MSMILDGSNGVTFNDSSLQGAAASPFGLKNRIINGAMNVWQRGTSFSASGGGYYHADRWQSFSQTYTASRSTDVPTGLAQYSLDISGGAGSYGTVMQRIEAANCADLVGQSVTVSVYVKAVSGGTNGLVCVLDYATVADNFTSQTNIGSVTMASTVSGSWTRYTATFNSLPSGAANGLQVFFYNNSVAANQYRYTLAQLEVGSTATPFERRMYGTELALCQRYLPAFNGMTDSFVGIAGSTSSIVVPIPFAVPVRTPPTGITASTASHFQIWNLKSTIGNATAIAFSSGGTDVGRLSVSFTAGSPTTSTGDAVLFNTNNASAQILFTGCEL